LALTAAAWGRSAAGPPGVARQNERGRLWDVLTMLQFAARGPGGGSPELRFGVHVRKGAGR
jgi:hypothetical protein